MLKNKIIVKKIRNIVIVIMALLIMLGIYRNIRNSLAENVTQIMGIATDNYKYLADEEFELEAKSVKDNMYEIELPDNINTKKISKISKVTLEEPEKESQTVEIVENKIQLTQEQLDTKKINIEVIYDVEILEENLEDEENPVIEDKEDSQEESIRIHAVEPSKILYNKILKYEDIEKGKLVEVKGYLPKDAKLKVEEVNQQKLSEIFGNVKIDVAYDIKILLEAQNPIPIDEANPEEQSGEVIETLEINPEEYGKTCEVSIKDANIQKKSQVYHVKDDNTYEKVQVKENEKESISFEATTFSVYAVSADEEMNRTTTVVAAAASDTQKPVWSTVSTTADAINKTAEAVIKGTDANFSQSTLTKDNIKVYVNGSQVTSGITVTLSSPTSVTNGVQYTIKVTGFSSSAKQVQIKIDAGVLTDTSGNTSVLSTVRLYNVLKSTSSENAETSGFLGNTNIQRQNIQNVTFVSSLSDAPEVDGNICWDVSAQGDGSILAWRTSSSPYTVKIGSNAKIYANQNSSYLFSYIGYADICKSTTVITNIDLLNVKSVTKMYRMFYYCGYTAMTSLDLGSEFDTSNVTDMGYMFNQCGYTAMTSLKLGSNFDTSSVTTMTWMFNWCGYTAMTSLNLGNLFDTSSVTDMGSMFSHTGYTAMTSLNLGNKFNTSNVTVMRYMFNHCGYTAMTSLNLGSQFNTSKVTDMCGMFYACGSKKMTSLNLGDKFDTSQVTDMQLMFAHCGYEVMTSLNLGSKFNTSKVTNMSKMFYACGRNAMTSLNLGDKFDTSQVTDMLQMFYACGYTAMTSLNLGDKFDTSKVTDMTEMFYSCGRTAMTKLEMGPAFKKIASTYTDFATGLGKENECTVFCREEIYSSLHEFKLSSSSTTKIAYDRGFINPTSNGHTETTVPTWESSVSDGEYSSNNTYFLKLVGTDNIGLNNTLSKLTTGTSGNLTVKVGGSSVSTSNLTIGTTTISSDGKTKTFPLTIKNYTGGTITISISAGALVDGSGNKSAAKTYSFTPDTTRPTWADSVSEGTYSASEKKYHLKLVGTDETGINDRYSGLYNSSAIADKNISIKVGTREVQGKDVSVNSTGTLSPDGKTKTFGVLIYNYTGGTISISISSGALVDTSGNKSASKTYSFTPDITAPTWSDSVSGGTWSTSAKTYALNLVGTDETGINSSSSTLSASNVTVKVGGTAVSSSNLTFGSATLSSDSKTKTFPLTIKNYTGGKIEITISAGALVDTTGNTSTAKTYTIITDSTAPTWASNVSGGDYSASNKTYSLNLVGSDETELDGTASTLTTGTSGNLTVKVGGTSVSTSNLTLGSTSMSSDGKTKTFPLTIKNYTGGSISITISANALVDKGGNKSTAKTYSFIPDTTPPTWASDVSNKTWSTSANTYSLSLVGSDNVELNGTSSTLSSSNVTVKVGGTAVSSSNLTFGSTSLSSDKKTKTFPLTIKSYTGGTIEITIKAGALVDTSKNTSELKTYTIITDETAPVWASNVSNGTYSASAKTYALNLVGSDEIALNNSSSTVSGKIAVKVNGSSTTNYTLGTASLSADNKTKTFPLTINNYTGGSISITISAEALVDTAGNKSASKTYSFTPDTTSPTWADSISNGTFSISAQTYKFNVVGSDETSLNASASTLTKGSNISITVNGNSANYTIGTATTSGNSKTFPITINSFTGGTVKVTISAGALKDTAGNSSIQKIYEFSIDGERPVWADNIIDGTYNATAKTYTLKFQGTDNDALAATTLSSSNVTITATDKNGTTTNLTNLSFGSVTTSSNNKTKTFPLTINNFTGGDIKITIKAGALKDVTGNESGPDPKIYEFSVDGVAPTWNNDIIRGTYDSSTHTYPFQIKGSDDVGLNNSASVLSSSNVTITVNGSNANFTFGNATLNDKTKTFPITLNNFYGGDVVVTISAQALEDTSGNKSAEKQYTFKVDATAPVWADDVTGGTYNASTKKYSLNLTGSDETGLNDSASVLNTTNTTITIDGTRTTDWTIGTTTLTNGKTKKFPLTLNNFTGGTVKINIIAGALTDTSGNTSEPKEYSFDGDVTKPQWQDGTGEYNPENQSYTITVTGTDNNKLNNVASELTTSNINLTVGGTQITPTITTTNATETSETYTLTWQNHSGGAVSLTINAGALVDATGNTSEQKVYTFSAVDATKPVWNASISNAQYTLANDTDDFGTFTFNLIGTDNVGLDNAKSVLNEKITITTDGTLVNSSDITIGTTTLSSDRKTKTFPITVRNFKGGDVVITISSGALVDTTGNTSTSKTYSFFRDVTRPVWADDISDAIYNPTSKEYSFKLIGSDEYSLNSTSSVLSSSNVTITVGGTAVTSSNLTFGSATTSGNTKTFPVVIKNYTGGAIVITIQKGALVDTAGNVSLAKTYPLFTPDITAPVWKQENAVYNPDDISYSVELVGTDETELNTTLSALVASGTNKNITVKCGSTTVTPTLTKTKTSSTEIRYKLTINNYPGGTVTITIDAGTLIDVSKNQSVQTTITLEAKDITKPTITAQNPEYSSADKTYTFEIVASDNTAIDDTTSALSTSGNAKNVTITCAGGSIETPTISIKQKTTTQIIYQVTIQNYPAGVVNVAIDAGAIKDTTGNKSVATNLTLPALDIANPYWQSQKPAVEYDENQKKVNLSLVGKDETSLNNTESTLTLGSNIIVYVDGQAVSSSNVVLGTPTISSDQLTKTFPLTINNFTGGILEISIGSGALKDNSGKTSDAKTYTFNDVIKPKWTIEPRGSYDRDNNIYTVTLNAIDDISLATANLASNLTVLVDGDGDGTGTAVTPTVTLVSDGETQKTFTVAIPNYLGGQIELSIAEGALVDDEGNRSKEAYFANIPDITRPVWEVGNVDFAASSADGDTIVIDLYGSDNVQLTDASLVKNNITVQFGDVIVERADIELTGPNSVDDGKGGVVYQLQIVGYTGEEITLIISPDTLIDDWGNKSARTTITSDRILPESDNDVPTVSNISHSVDTLHGTVIIDFDIRDSWYNFQDLIEAGEYTMSAKNFGGGTEYQGAIYNGSYSSVDISSATISVVKQTRIAKGYHYRIKIDGLSSILTTKTAYERQGTWGQYVKVQKPPLLTVKLNANAATDLFNKGNVLTNLLSDQEVDFTVSDGDAAFTLKTVSLNKSQEAMYIDLNATWTTSSGWSWGIGGSGSTMTDFTLTSDMITSLTIDGESILDYIKEQGQDRLQISNGTTTSTVIGSSTTYPYTKTYKYSKDIRIILTDLVEDTRQSGKEFLEWSGNVALTVTPTSGTNFNFEEETLATENADNVLFVDFVDPELEVLSSTINDEEVNSVTIRVKATDKYFVPNSVFNTDKVKVTVDGEYATEEQGIYISFSAEEELLRTRNGAQEQYGIIQDITITGLADKLDKKIILRIETGAVSDLSGNVNAIKKITLFNWLKETNTETAGTSAFLGNSSLQRQNIEKITFVNSLSGANSTKWDVSALQDNSILAWYTGSGPYQVYIGSDNPIYANPDSSYLFSYIGSSSSCTTTSIFSNLNLLNTRFTTNMSYMFNNFGSAKMTSLNLGAFDTSRVQNMTGMFQSCGKTAMTSLNLGTSFKINTVTNMSNMFNGCGLTKMQTLTLGDNFDTTNVQNMSGMFQNCGQTVMASLDLGEKFYTTSATNMSNMFNGCGTTAMTSLDLGPAFTKIASTNTGFATNCGKSGTAKIYVGSSIYSSKTAFKLNADSSSTISYTRGTITPKYKPEWTKTYAAYDTENRRLIVRLEGKVNTTNYTNAIQTVINNFSNGVLTEDSTFANQNIKVRINGEEVSTIQKELSMVVKGPAETVNCEIILTNFVVETGMLTGKSYFEWAGNVALQIAEEMLVDGYGNRSLEQSDEATGTMQRIEIKDDVTTDHMIDTMMFVDFVKPVITYQYSTSDINKTEKTAQIVFSVTDKYYESEDISLDNLTILMDGTNLKQTPVNIGLNEEDITESGKTIGRKYTLTLSELQQDVIATGKSYLDFSGPVTIAVPGGKVTDKSGNTNNAKTITVGVDETTYTDNTDDTSAVVVDVVSPMWTNVENGVTLSGNTVAVKVKATDKYFNKDNCTLASSNVKLYLDGVETTSGITISVSNPTLMPPETRLVNGVSTTVYIGAEYTITITGITLDYDQAKLEILAGAITDLNGNTSGTNQVIIYNRLKSAETETSVTSGFLGNTSIQRQNIQKVEFISGISGSQEQGVQQVWDVSAVGDGTIKAWTKQTTAPYTVYIGSDGGILANRNSSYLFAHIGYGSSCTATEVISHLNILDTSSVTNMTAMFKNCGYQKMTTLNLGTNFYTSNVTNMSSMFEGCGYNAMDTFSFGSNFNTSAVTNMSGMFQDFGPKLTSLNLGATGVTFNTANVTDMSNMFNGCGKTLMQTLTLGSSFNTANVTQMNGMFKECGYEAMTSLNLGSNFNTIKVQNMSSMFERTGYQNMLTLTLGNNFNTSAVTDMNSMFKECGASSLQSLQLGGLFYTTNVTNMTSMFNGCGQVNMTTLDLGPAFTKIASTNTDFATNCGKADTVIIYTGSAIYSNENAFKLSVDSSTTISFTRGTINPKYKPEWTVSAFTASNSQLTITLQGNVNSTNYGSYTKTVTNRFANGTTSLVNVSVDGDTTANSQITKTISGVSSTPATTVTCTLTLTNFQESVRESGRSFTEWAGNVTLQFIKGSLVDSYGNKNLDQSDDTAMFADFVKPDFTYEHYETEINTNTSIVTVYFSVTDKYFASIDTTKLTANNITVKVANDSTTNSAITKTLEKVEDIVYGTNNRKIGEKYKLIIEGLDKGDGVTYSGTMTLAFQAGVAKDNGPTGNGSNQNVSSAKTITIGIDDPANTDHGHNSSVIVDVVDPIWKVENVTGTTADLIAIDKYISTYPTATELKSQMQVKVGETDVTSQITITGPTSVTNGKKYQLTIPASIAQAQPESYANFLEARRKYLNGEDGGRLYREANSGVITVILPKDVITDTSGNKNLAKEFSMGRTDDTLKPEVVNTSVAKNTTNKTETIIFDVTDKYFAQMNYSTIELKSKIHVFVDGEETTALTEDLQLVETLEASIDGSIQTIGKRYQLVLSNFEVPQDGKGLQNGYDFKGISGTVSIEIDEGVATDQSGNTSGGRKADGTNTSEGQPIIGDLVDFIKPDVIYRKANTSIVTNNGQKEVQIVFDITDKYYNSATALATDGSDLTIMIQDGTVDTNYINLKNIPGVSIGLSSVNKVQTGTFKKTVNGNVTSVSNQVIGKTYTLTISNLEQAGIVAGRNYLDYSGNVTIGIPANKVSDASGNINASKTITMGIDLPEETGSKEVLDIVRPIWTLESQSVDIDKQEATITIRGTDKYYSGSSLTANNIELYIDGTKVTTNGTSTRKVSIESTTRIDESWTINGTTSTVQVGVTYVIKVTGFEVDSEQAKIIIPAGTLTDTSGNTSEQLETVLYSCLMSASGETLATAGNDATRIFLGNPHNIQRQNIESITFVNSLSGANTTKWDVSAVQDGSIMAWYTGSGPYQVYIGSNGGIFANPNSSYLFSYIGKASNCTATSTIVNLNLLETGRITNMSYMFAHCGYQKMGSLNLGSKFYTEKVTNMSHMFDSCGYTNMGTLTLGDNFNTSSVQDMSYMFANCGFTKMGSLNLSSSASATEAQKALMFDTILVTNMSNMFENCGKTLMTSLNLGDNFNTENVQNMSAMFQNCGQAKLTSLDLGNLFNTSSVANMSNMFNGCGQTAMVALDLGPAFTKIANTSTNFIANCGKTGTVIYAPEAIYKNRTSFKKSSTDTSGTIAVSAGRTINPIYRPEWEIDEDEQGNKNVSIDTTNKTLSIVVKARANKDETINGVNIKYSSEVTSALSQDDITVYIDEEEATSITKEVSLVTGSSATGSVVKYKITLSEFNQTSYQTGKNFLEWSGKVAIKIGGRGNDTGTYTKNVLKDTTYGNRSMMETDETGSWINVIYKDSKMFADFMKPQIVYEYSNTIIDHGTEKVTVVFDITDKYFKESTLTADKITVTVGGMTATNAQKDLGLKTISTDQTVGNITYKTNGEIYYTINGTPKKIGERYQLELTNLDQGEGGDYSGIMTLAFPQNEIAEDTSENGNVGKTITVGIDDPITGDGHNSGVIVDVVDPVWKAQNINIDKTNKRVTVDLIATDKYLTGIVNCILTSENLASYLEIEVDGIDATSAITKTLGSPTFSTNSTTGLKEIKYTLTLSNWEQASKNGKSYFEYSGTTKIKIAAGTITDQYANSSNQQEFTLGHVDFIKPRIEKVSSKAYEKYEEGNPIQEKQVETIIFNVIDKYLDISDAVVASEVTVYVDGETASGLGKEFGKNTRTSDIVDGEITYTKEGDIKAIINGEQKIIGQQYILKLFDFEQATKNAKGYKDYSGTVSINVAPNAVKDTSNNTNDAITGETAIIGDYVDFVTPYITYEYLTSDIDRIGTDANGKSFQMTFTVTDKYYTSGELSIDDLIIKMDDGKNIYNLKEEPVTITFVKSENIMASNVKMTNATTGAVQTVATTTIGHKYVLTISNLEQLEIKDGNTTLDYSGIVTVAIAADKIYDRVGANASKTITSGVSIPDETADPVVVDVVKPIWKKTTGGSIDLATRKAIIIVNGTDTYYKSNSLTAAGIKVYAYTGTTATEITSSITKTLEEVQPPLQETVTVNGTTSTRRYGVQYKLTLTGIPIDKDQIKVVIPADTLEDNSGNKSDAYEMKLYTTLMSAATETTATSAFLGNSSIQRQNIESITFKDSTEEAENNKWDVSAAQDGSIWAWYTGTGPYQVYIGSDEFIFANADSSYLFAHIGYGTNCTVTNIINRLEILNTRKATDMNHMFYNAGYRKMQELNLAGDLNTENVTNMTSMFEGCGFAEMQTLTLGSSFNTSAVTDMSGMFKNCGKTNMESLNLGSNFNTSQVTDMSYMFEDCGSDNMTTFSFGNHFNTSAVTKMNGMFKNFGPNVTILDLSEAGVTFNTSSVTNMSNMFNGCGKKGMQTLILGSSFNTSAVTNMSGMFQDCGGSSDTFTSLDLGNQFYTTAVTDMSNMFNGCGTTAMTKLDLGPAFTKIADSCDGFMTNCGTSAIVVYAPESIYANRTAFKRN